MKPFRAFTDTLFVSLGDNPNEVEPVRDVVVLNCDGKYCDVKVEGELKRVSVARVYLKPGRYLEIENIKKKILLDKPL